MSRDWTEYIYFPQNPQSVTDLKSPRRGTNNNRESKNISKIWIILCILSFPMTRQQFPHCRPFVVVLTDRFPLHYRDVIVGTMANQITSLTIPHDCLLNRLFRRIPKKTSKLRVTGLCAGNSPMTGEFPTLITRKMFPFDDVIMEWTNFNTDSERTNFNNEFINLIQGPHLLTWINFNPSIDM